VAHICRVDSNGDDTGEMSQSLYHFAQKLFREYAKSILDLNMLQSSHSAHVPRPTGWSRSTTTR
jgi:hypothetical protein